MATFGIEVLAQPIVMGVGRLEKHIRAGFERGRKDEWTFTFSSQAVCRTVCMYVNRLTPDILIRALTAHMCLLSMQPACTAFHIVVTPVLHSAAVDMLVCACARLHSQQQREREPFLNSNYSSPKKIFQMGLKYATICLVIKKPIQCCLCL